MNAYAAGPSFRRLIFPRTCGPNSSPRNCSRSATSLRQFIVDVVSEKGGHFGASLGVVELTVALHYVFNTLRTKSWWMSDTKPTATRF